MAAQAPVFTAFAGGLMPGSEPRCARTIKPMSRAAADASNAEITKSSPARLTDRPYGHVLFSFRLSLAEFLGDLRMTETILAQIEQVQAQT